MNKYLMVFYVFVICGSSCKSRDEQHYEQYVVNGQNLYNANCSNCHGLKGEGLKNLYPPLLNSDYLKNHENVVCIIKNGVSGEMKVNGVKYNQAMPANPKLYDLDIAQITTFIYAEFMKEKRYIKADSVTRILLTCEP